MPVCAPEIQKIDQGMQTSVASKKISQPENFWILSPFLSYLPDLQFKCATVRIYIGHIFFKAKFIYPTRDKKSGYPQGKDDRIPRKEDTNHRRGDTIDDRAEYSKHPT